jgi:hypothetical protein
MSHMIARLQPDFVCTASMHGDVLEGYAMDANAIEITTKAYLKKMLQRLDQAAGIARVAQTCADNGNLKKGVEIALDVEPLVYEAKSFLECEY